jgi:HAD superfamily phosphatase
MVDLSKIALVLDIDGVIRDVAGSYRRALADTVEHFTAGAYRPTPEDIDLLKAEGIWNNDWEASQELIDRYFSNTERSPGNPGDERSYDKIVQFFQSRYRGSDLNNPQDWNGYIASEPLIATPEYFQNLTNTQIAWGFFSGATRGSATYVLQRLQIYTAVLVAMEDAPGKPDPKGLLDAIAMLGNRPIGIYVGDTVADMHTAIAAKGVDPDRRWIAVGAIPPHIQSERAVEYTNLLRSHGADLVVNSILELTPEAIAHYVAQYS